MIINRFIHPINGIPRFLHPIDAIPPILPVYLQMTGLYALQRRLISHNLSHQLCSDICEVYSIRKEENLMPSLTTSDVASLTFQIRNGTYCLSPLEFLSCPLREKNVLLQKILPDYPDCFVSENESTLNVIKASNVKDSLVLMALSLTLLRLIYGSVPRGYRLVDKFPTYIEEMNQMCSVKQVMKIDVSSSLSLITKDQVLKSLRAIIGNDEYLFRLMITMIYLPIYSQNGEYISTASAIPPTGDILRTLFDMVIMDMFNAVFVRDYPDIYFNRFVNEILIVEKDEKDAPLFPNEIEIKSYLKDIGLRGQVKTISQGKGFLLCGDGMGLPISKVSIAMINNRGDLIISDANTLMDRISGLLEGGLIDIEKWKEKREE